MAAWQVLRASRASQVALGYRVHHGAGVTVHYSTAPASPAGPDSGRSFCLSGEKRSLQQLNRRLAAYLQQVQILEADNQRLEQQIQAELDRKCPRQLRQLDRHLRTVSLLQDQISECLSAQAQVKLQLLEEELRVYELNIRCEKERERSCDLEAELSTLRLIEEELNVHALPEIQSLLNELTQQQVELQIRHQQEMQVLRVQVSGGVTVEMQTAESSDLVKQLDHLRQTSVTLIDKNHNESCFNTRVTAFGPPVGSEVDQAELEELRRTAISLTEELKQLQTLIVELDLSGQEKTETFVLQLVFLQQTADSLCRDLDSVLQAAAQQTADHQALLDIKSHLEAEIQGYRRLLDGLSHQGVSDLASTSACVATCPYVFRTNITSDKAFRVQSGNVRTLEVQKISGGHVNMAGPTQLSQTVMAVQPISVHSKHPKSSPIPSINTLDCVHVSELQNSLIVRDEISQGLEEGPAVKTSTTKIISTQFPDSKPETSKQVDLWDAEIGTNIQVDIAEIIPYAEPEVDKAETETVNLGQMDHIEDCELETPLEVSESNVHRSEIVQGEVSDGMNLMDDWNIERQEHKEGVGAELVPKLNESSGLCDGSNSRDNLLGDTDAGSNLTSARSGCPNNLENHDGRTTGTEILKAEEDRVEVVHETSKVQSTVLDDLARQETLDGSTDSGVALSSYTLEDFASQKEAHESISPTKPDTQLKPEMSQIPVQSPNDTEMHPGSNGSEPHLNPVEAATLMDDKDMESQGKKREEEAEGPLVIPRLDASSPLSNVSNTEPNTSREDTRSNIANASSGSTDSTDVLKTEETKLRAVGGFHTNMVKVDPTDLENGLAGLAIQEPSKMSSGLDSGLALSPAGPEEFTKEAQSPSESPDDPEMYLHSDTYVHPTEAEATVTDKGTERQEHKEGVGAEVVTDTGSSLTSDIFGCPNSLGNHDGRTTGTEILKAEADGGEVVHETRKAKVHSTELGDLAGQEALDRSTHSGVALSSYSHEDFVNQKEADVLASPTRPDTQVNPEMCDNGLDGIAIQEPSKISSSLTDSGLALSSSGPEEYLSTKEAQSPPDDPEMYLHSDTYLHSTEAEATLADKDTERQEHEEEEEISEGTLTVPVLDPRSLLSDVSHLELNKPMEDTDAGSGTATPLSGCTNSTDNIDGPDDPEMCLSPNDSDTRLSPVELKMCPSSNCEEDEEASLSLTEANTHVRPVENYVLSARETGQWSSFSGDQASPDEGRNTKVILSESQGRGLGFRPFEGSEIRSVTLNDTNISSRPTSESTSIQVSNRHGSLGFGGPGDPSIIADKEEQFGFGGLYWKRQRDKDRSSTADENKQQRLDIENNVRKQTNSYRQVVNKPGSSEREFNKSASFASSDTGTTFRSEASKSGGDIHSNSGIISGNAHNATSDVQGRFRRGSTEWMIYGGSLGRTSANLTNPRSEEYLPADTLPASSLPATGRFGSRGSGEWTVYGGSLRRKSSLDGGTSLSSKGNEESQPEGGRFSRRGSGEWMVYGGSLGSKSNLTSSDSLPNAVSKEYQPTAVNIPTIPPGAGRFGSGGSGEWKVYGWSTGRLSSAGSGGQLSSGNVVRRSSSVGSGGRLSGSGSGGRLSSSPGSHRISSSRRLSSTGSGEWKPVYSSASGSKISVGSTVRPGGGRTTSSQRTPSPGGRIGVSGGSGGWLSCSAGSGSRHSSTSSNERISGRSGGRISSSSGSGRTNSTGGRVISSSDRPIGSTGSGAGSNKERISVCKMAALTISAAGRERSKERRKQPQRSQHQQAAVSSPLVQRWLTTSVGVMSADPQGTDDIMRL